MQKTCFPRSPSLLLAVIVLGHAVFDALFAPFGTPPDEYPYAAAYLVMGVIFLQPVLFALWAGLGSQPYFQRLPWTAVACVVVAYAQSVPWFRVVGRVLSSQMATASLLLTLILFGIATLLFFAIRWLFGWHIAQDLEETSQETGNRQFGLRYLLAWITGSAMLLAVGRVLVKAGALRPEGGLRETAVQVLTFLGVISIALFPSIGVPWLTLAYRRQARVVVIGWLVGWGALTWAAVSLFRMGAPVAASHIIGPILLLQVGAAAAGFASALPLRLARFRLQRSSSPTAHRPQD